MISGCRMGGSRRGRWVWGAVDERASNDPGHAVPGLFWPQLQSLGARVWPPGPAAAKKGKPEGFTIVLQCCGNSTLVSTARPADSVVPAARNAAAGSPHPCPLPKGARECNAAAGPPHPCPLPKGARECNAAAGPPHPCPLPKGARESNAAAGPPHPCPLPRGASESNAAAGPPHPCPLPKGARECNAAAGPPHPCPLPKGARESNAAEAGDTPCCGQWPQSWRTCGCWGSSATSAAMQFAFWPSSRS